VDEETFAFGPFRLIPARRMLFEDGKPLRLGSGAMDILIVLVEGAGETIHKDQLIAGTWPDTVVDEGALRVHVAALRKALGEGRARKRYIVNNPGRAQYEGTRARPAGARSRVRVQKSPREHCLTRKIPYASEQGIFGLEQGIGSCEQGIFHAGQGSPILVVMRVGASRR
jgi:hypothetical protein